MTAAIQIDTLAFAKKLKEAGADERLADAIVEGITAADTSNMATKEDLRIETVTTQHGYELETRNSECCPRCYY